MTELCAQIEGVLEREGSKHVGIVAGALRQGGTCTVSRGLARDDTIFEVGSITKVLTATVLADMACDGLVGVEDPISDHLPAGVALPMRERPATLGDLAAHTSGLPRLPSGMTGRAIGSRRQNPYADYGEADLLAAVPAARLKGPPGTKVRYSNFGAGLLGHVLCARAGVGYEQLLRERICDPLGMQDTSTAVPEAKRERFAHGHSRRGRPVPHWDFAALAPAGAARSTVADLLGFLRAQLDPTSSPLSAAVELSQRPRARAGRMSIGLGWHILQPYRAPHPIHFHNGGTGGFRSFAGFVRQTQTAVVVLSSSARDVDAIALRLLRTIGEA